MGTRRPPDDLVRPPVDSSPRCHRSSCPDRLPRPSLLPASGCSSPARQSIPRRPSPRPPSTRSSRTSRRTAGQPSRSRRPRPRRCPPSRSASRPSTRPSSSARRATAGVCSSSYTVRRSPRLRAAELASISLLTRCPFAVSPRRRPRASLVPAALPQRLWPVPAAAALRPRRSRRPVLGAVQRRRRGLLPRLLDRRVAAGLGRAGLGRTRVGAPDDRRREGRRRLGLARERGRRQGARRGAGHQLPGARREWRGRRRGTSAGRLLVCAVRPPTSPLDEPDSPADPPLSRASYLRDLLPLHVHRALLSPPFPASQPPTKATSFGFLSSATSSALFYYPSGEAPPYKGSWPSPPDKTLLITALIGSVPWSVVVAAAAREGCKRVEVWGEEPVDPSWPAGKAFTRGASCAGSPGSSASPWANASLGCSCALRYRRASVPAGLLPFGGGRGRAAAAARLQPEVRLAVNPPRGPRSFLTLPPSTRPPAGTHGAELAGTGILHG